MGQCPLDGSHGILPELDLLEAVDGGVQVEVDVAAVTDQDAGAGVLEALASMSASSLKKEGTWKTTPEPVRLMQPGATRPQGSRWKSQDTPLALMDAGPVAASGVCTYLGLRAEDVGQLSLALIASLRSEDNCAHCGRFRRTYTRNARRVRREKGYLKKPRGLPSKTSAAGAHAWHVPATPILGPLVGALVGLLYGCKFLQQVFNCP